MRGAASNYKVYYKVINPANQDLETILVRNSLGNDHILGELKLHFVRILLPHILRLVIIRRKYTGCPESLFVFKIGE